MSNFHEAPPEELKFALNKKPYPLGSLDLVGGSFKIMPARVENPYPNMFREAIYPDGTMVIQGAYAWTQGSEGGVVWRDLPQVYVDEDGQEITLP